MAGPIKIFISYSHRDESLRDELTAHLSVLRHDGIISDWYDRKIEPGTRWSEAIANNLKSSQLILLLVSSDFLASDYCYKIEMLEALKLHDEGISQVVPVILRPVVWQPSPLGELNALPKDAKPVVSWPTHDDAWCNVVSEIKQMCDRFESLSKASVSELISREIIKAAAKQEGALSRAIA